jgi:hypothetical protein
LQLPYNLDAEHEIPQFNASKYYWEAMNNIDQVISIYDPDLSAALGYSKHEIVTSPPPPSSFDSPTEQQFLNNTTIQLGKFKMRICIEYRDGWGSVSAYWYDEEYTAWLEPRKK